MTCPGTCHDQLGSSRNKLIGPTPRTLRSRIDGTVSKSEPDASQTGMIQLSEVHILTILGLRLKLVALWNLINFNI